MPRVVIPWSANNGPERRRALRWIVKQYERWHPDWSIDIRTGDEGEWRKGAIVNAGIADAPPGVVIVADADCWTTGLARSVMAVTCGAAEWAIPHFNVYRLSPKGTEVLIASGVFKAEDAARKYEGLAGGGFVVAERQTLLDVPMDERFVGWGQEDESWGFALRTLAGSPERGQANLLHLWHPSPERQDRRVGNPDGWRLMKSYGMLAKANDADGMKELVSGAH
jgi:hypothetical protein